MAPEVRLELTSLGRLINSQLRLPFRHSGSCEFLMFKIPETFCGSGIRFFSLYDYYSRTTAKNPDKGGYLG